MRQHPLFRLDADGLTVHEHVQHWSIEDRRWDETLIPLFTFHPAIHPESRGDIVHWLNLGQQSAAALQGGRSA